MKPEPLKGKMLIQYWKWRYECASRQCKYLRSKIGELNLLLKEARGISR